MTSGIGNGRRGLLARLGILALATSVLASAVPAPSASSAAQGHVSAARPAAAQRPDILFILVDDMGFGDLSVMGNRAVATPNIDRLARDGVLMTQFYDAAPICSASRAGILTGRFPARERFVTFEDNRAHNAVTGQADWLDPALTTLPRLLHGAGYATGHFGKWHLGGGRDVGDAPLPTAYGFDESYTQFEGLGPRVLPSNVDGEMAHLVQQSEALGRGPVDRLRRGEISGRYIDKALDFIARHRGRPWFVQLWPDDVHAPWIPDEDQLALADGRGRDGNEARFFGVLVAFDRQIGRLVAALRAMGELDRTLIVLTSDNGPNSVARFYANGSSPPGSSGIYRGRKDSLYEGGIRQPLIVRWPGHVPAGGRDDRTIGGGVDLLPSLAHAAGVPTPAGLDGIDLSPAWRGQPIRTRPDLFWTYGAFGPRGASPRPFLPRDNSPGFAIRSGRWKLLADSGGADAQLYSLDSDPREEHDVAAARPAVTRALTQRLEAWRRSLPPFPPSRPGSAPGNASLAG